MFIEAGATTWCPNCPTAAEALHAIYNSSDYPFYYIALVLDQNNIAQNRFWWHYQGMAIPTVFFDGGYAQRVGLAGTAQQTEQEYRSVIEQAGNRTVHPLEMTTTVTGHGDATLDITVTVINTGSQRYIGILHSAVTEIVSRWNDQKGHPYHFGFLDYAIKKVISLSPGKSRTYSVTWDGAKPHTNVTFPDIADDNIMVISTVSHWLPHVVAKEDYVNTHIAFYTDQTVGARVTVE
jgi:hypothetical protein